MRFVDLFAGLGGFHLALTYLGHECVAASEINEELRHIYKVNFKDDSGMIVGDIRDNHDRIPDHDILCAGFPCQPFSKSGSQEGFLDVTRGTAFHELLAVADRHKPLLILLENVGNFARHDGGRTWDVVRESLIERGYNVRGTEPKVMGGHGLISPHHFGFPHRRERFFVVASQEELPDDPFPPLTGVDPVGLEEMLLEDGELTSRERDETAVSERDVACIEHWNRLLQSLPDETRLPSFPIWADEIDATYAFEERAPALQTARELREALGIRNGRRYSIDELLEQLPRYARTRQDFPRWKRQFIRQNREWFARVRGAITSDWIRELGSFPHSKRKLEWNCQGEKRDLWSHVLQFRPSGLRVSRGHAIPALVASTTSQVPIIGSRKRYLARREALRCQGFPDTHVLPEGHGSAFRALGNAIHVDVVRKIAESALTTESQPA